MKCSALLNYVPILSETNLVFFILWERLKVGTVPTFKTHLIGTVPTFKMHDVGTVPTFKTHHVGTIKNQNQL